MRLSWFNYKTREGVSVFVTVIDDPLIGFASFGHFRNWPGYWYTVELSVYTDHRHHGIGIGKTLLPILIEKAKQMNYHAMIEGINSANLGSMNFHQLFDFVELAHFKQVGFKFSKRPDLKFFLAIAWMF